MEAVEKFLLTFCEQFSGDIARVAWKGSEFNLLIFLSNFKQTWSSEKKLYILNFNIA